MSKIIEPKKSNRIKIYEGNRKDVFQNIEDESSLTMFFKDDLVSGKKKLNISGKGILNNTISSFLMQKIDMVGIQNHFIEKTNMREQVVQILDMIPVQVRVTNVAVDDYVTKFGLQEGYLFDKPMIEFNVKNKFLPKYPSINETQIKGFNWLTGYEIRDIKKITNRVNDFLSGYFAGSSLRMVEIYLEFGRVFNGEDFIFMLADEITPESCMLWDINSNKKFDVNTISKSRNPIEVYKEIAKRIGIT